MDELVERYWQANPVDGLATQLVRLSQHFPDHCTVWSFGTSFRGRPLLACRVGHGDLRVAVVAGLHSHEPFNSFGITAFVESLLSGRGLHGEDLAEWANNVRNSQTILTASLVNVDGATRFAAEVPGCWLPNRFTDTETDRTRWAAAIREPMITLGLERGALGFNRLSDEQMRYWLDEKGGDLGWLFSDQGVDLWEDWEKFDAPESRALRDLIVDFRPDCVLELHHHELASRIFVPIPSAAGQAARRQLIYGEEMMTRLRATGLPGSLHSVHTYAPKEHFQQFPDWAFRRLGCLVLFGETSCGVMPGWLREQMRGNPLQRRDADQRVPTQSELIATPWVWLKALIDLGGLRRYQ